MTKLLITTATVALISTSAYAESFLDSFNFDLSVKPIESCEHSVNHLFEHAQCDKDGAKLQLDISRGDDNDNHNDNGDTHHNGRGHEIGRGHFEHGKGKGLGHYK